MDLFRCHGTCCETVCIWVLLACGATAALGANEIQGSVRNQTRDQPAVGDDVILIRLDPGMPEEARAKTDARGAFRFNPQHSDRPYLVRVNSPRCGLRSARGGGRLPFRASVRCGISGAEGDREHRNSAYRDERKTASRLRHVRDHERIETSADPGGSANL